MGCIRLLLALAVIVEHCEGKGLMGLPFFGGTAYQAVFCFFIISGFYMAMVLKTKYQNDALAFYRARILRLYPVYALSFGLFFGLQSAARIAGKPMGVWHAIENVGYAFSDYVWAIFSNLTGLGSDSLMLWSALSDKRLAELLILPVVWSLSVEVAFYLLAPFILLKSNRFIVCLFLLAFSARLLVSWLHQFAWNAWNYYFFPTNLCFFLAGALAWNVSSSYDFKKKPAEVWLAWMILAFSVVFGRLS